MSESPNERNALTTIADESTSRELHDNFANPDGAVAVELCAACGGAHLEVGNPFDEADLVIIPLPGAMALDLADELLDAYADVVGPRQFRVAVTAAFEETAAFEAVVEAFADESASHGPDSTQGVQAALPEGVPLPPHMAAALEYFTD